MKNNYKIEKLYLTTWELNAARIINRLYEMIKENGGYSIADKIFLSISNTIYEFENRTINTDLIRIKSDLQKINENLKNNEYDPERKKRILEYKEKKEKELQENEKAKKLYNKKYLFKNYIHFLYNNDIYYIQLDENPFFDWYIIKEPNAGTNGEIVTYNKYYMDTLKKDFIENYENITSYFQFLTDEQINDITKRLFDYIINCNYSEIVKEKKRVPNYYDNSYHYEYITEKRQVNYIKEDKSLC